MNEVYQECLRLFGRDWKDVTYIGSICKSPNRFTVYRKTGQNYIACESLETLKEGRKLFKKYLKTNINLNKEDE